MAAAGLLSRNPNAPSGLEAGQASSKASSGLEEGRAVVEQEMKAMAIPTAGSREEKAKVGRSYATLVEQAGERRGQLGRADARLGVLRGR
jgi:hypothetical protein